MTSPRHPDDDREVETRLQVSWQRAVSRAKEDLEDRDLVSGPLAAGRLPRRDPAARAMVGVGAIALLAVALVVGWNGRQLLEPPGSSTAPIGSQPVESGSPAPTGSANPDESGVPVLNRYETLPSSIGGQRVVAVGPEADARIAVTTDDSPIYVSGWLVDGDWNWTRCSESYRGVPAPSGTIGSDCIGTLIRAAADGGAVLRIFSTVTERPSLVRPGPARVQPVLVQVHVRDLRCDGPDCARMPVLDRVLLYGAMRVAPAILAATLPPGGISAEQAVDIARNQIQRYPLPEPGQLPLLRVVVGTGGWLDDSSDRYDRWEWVVDLVSDDGYTEHVVSVDYLDGTYLGTGGGPVAAGVASTPVLDPGQTFPPSVNGQPVVQIGPDADALIAAATDDSPLYVSGWLLGADRLSCGLELGTPAPNGVFFADCTATLLRATGDGGASLPIFLSLTGDHLARPGPTQQRPVLLQVHTHDPGCLVADCTSKAVFDRVVMYGSARIAPWIVGVTQPPEGVSMEAAVSMARQYLTDHPMGSGGDLVLLSAEAGPGAVVDEGGAADTTWIWAVTFATADGHETYTVDVDYRHGTASHARGGSLLPPP